MMNEIVLNELLGKPEPPSGHYRWLNLDEVYSQTRRRLYQISGWRYGPNRAWEVFEEATRQLDDFATIKGASFCDLGCGRYNPCGISALMYLFGASSCLALDSYGFDDRRAAEALYDLLCECQFRGAYKDQTDQEKKLFQNRLERFDLLALRSGNLKEGLRETPLRHILTDIHNPNIEKGSIDVVTSRGVLEHFLDIPMALRQMHELMSPGGVGYHHIDLVDHRAYVDPDRFHFWSFLAESDDWSDGLVNRLRPSELESHIRETGFEILKAEKRLGKPPPGFLDGISDRFKEMAIDDLCATGLMIVIRRPV